MAVFLDGGASSVLPVDGPVDVRAQQHWDKVRQFVRDVFRGMKAEKGWIPLSASSCFEKGTWVVVDGIESHLSSFSTVRPLWMNSDANVSLQEFVREILIGTREVETSVRFIPYFSREDLLKAEVKIQRGRFFQMQDRLQNGTFLYVLTMDDRLLLSPRLILEGDLYITHASLSNGRPVKAAGEIELQGGRLLKISNVSERYQIEVPSMLNIVVWLEEKGVFPEKYDLSIRYSLQTHQKTCCFFPASRFVTRCWEKGLLV